MITANKIKKQKKKKKSWRLFRRSTLIRGYKNETELKLIPEKPGGDTCKAMRKTF